MTVTDWRTEARFGIKVVKIARYQYNKNDNIHKSIAQEIRRLLTIRVAANNNAEFSFKKDHLKVVSS